jgi:hypothetical protein
MRATLFFALASLASAAIAAPPAANHPIIGTWTFQVPYTHCTETYHFRADGTMSTTSAEETTEITFDISPGASFSGFYKLTDKVTKTNGKKDCSGELTQVGEETLNYVQLDPKGESMVMCKAPSLDECFGPLWRPKAK